MSEKIVQFNEEIIKGQIKELVRGSVEETLNAISANTAAHPTFGPAPEGTRSMALAPSADASIRR